VTKDVPEQGAYAVNICDMGEWQEVILDDYFPCFPWDKTPTFSRANGNELWVLLLEKLWAKLYGGYANIEAGLTRECLHDLTGAPTKYFLTTDMTAHQKDLLWKDLLHGDQMKFIMTCGFDDFSGDGTDESTKMGLLHRMHIH